VGPRHAEVRVERDEEGEGAGAPGDVSSGESGGSPDIAVGEGAPEPSCNVQDTTPISALECGFELVPDPVPDLQTFAFQLVGTWFCHDPAFNFSTGPSLGVVFRPGGRYQVLVGDQSTVNDDVTCSPGGGLTSGSWFSGCDQKNSLMACSTAGFSPTRNTTSSA
jgi:hypothetical protein